MRVRPTSRSARCRQPLRSCLLGALITASLLLAGCTELEKPRSDAFFAQTPSPRKQVFRWSNGRTPRLMDPARAIASPETDLVRAVYEGLTELDPQTLTERPAAAEKWAASEDLREWRFEIRSDARWSSGEPVTADDFLRSWKRVVAAGKDAPHRGLFANVVGVGIPPRPAGERDTQTSRSPEPAPSDSPRSGGLNGNTAPSVASRVPQAETEAGDDRTLIVRLAEPDRDLPKLVAHPAFRPVYQGRQRGDLSSPNASSITNGAFSIASADEQAVTLEPSATYWNRTAVKLEQVKFVATESTEKALEAYRAGELEAITNASFSPVLLKLLSPYEDFRRTTFAAINLYEFNTSNEPFDDRRVRQALSIALERDRLSEGELEGSTVSAYTFTPFRSTASALVQDKQRAADLLDEAGFPNGRGFPVIRLVINRNETQQRIARSVANMWRESLNVETEILIREPAEMDTVRSTGDFDLIRRGVVLATPSEAANIRAIFDPIADRLPSQRGGNGAGPPGNGRIDAGTNSNTSIVQPMEEPRIVILSSHEEALYELRAIPLYFPSSYSLVKPYVLGFESNALDAPVLLDVRIDEAWQPPAGTPK